MKGLVSIVAISILVAFNNCHSHEEFILKAGINDSSEMIGISDSLFYPDVSKFIKPVNVISINGKDSLYIAGANKLIPFNNKFIYADFRLGTILILDSSGNEISKIGGLGSGKGQYFSVEDFNVDFENDQLLVFSNESGKLGTYSKDGRFIKENKLGFWAYQFSILDSKHLLFYLDQNTGHKSGQFNLLVTDRSGRIVQRLFPITNLPHMGIAYSGFIRNSENSILYSEPFSNLIYEIRDSMYQKKYYLPFGNKLFSGSKNMSLEGLWNAAKVSDWIAGPVYESNDYIFLRYANGREIQPIIFKKGARTTINGRNFHNKIIENLLYNVCGEKNGVFYSIVDFDKVFPLLEASKADLDDIKKFDMRLSSKLNEAFPFKSPVLFSFKFIF